MELKMPGKLIFSDEDKTEEKLDKISSVTNPNFEDIWKVMSALDFDSNFKGAIKEVTIDHGEEVEIYHKIKKAVTNWIIVGGSRIERLVLGESNRSKVTFTCYLKSTTISANGSSTTDVLVYNPFIFEVGDSIKIGTSTCNIEEIDLDTNKLVIDTSISFTAGDLVLLTSSEEKLFLF